MQITRDKVVSLNYVLTDDDGETIDSSEGEPFAYLHGHGQLVVGLERQLEGRGVGEKLSVVVEPAEGYGEHDPEHALEVSRDELPDDLDLELGLELAYEGDDGEAVSMWVTDMTDTHVTLDGNHPLAGARLHFAVEVRGVRDADASELEHGHPHGEGDEHDQEMTGPYTH